MYERIEDEDFEFLVFFREEHGGVPLGARIDGDLASELSGKKLRLTSPKGVRTIHLVTDSRYEEGYTYLSFAAGVPA